MYLVEVDERTIAKYISITAAFVFLSNSHIVYYTTSQFVAYSSIIFLSFRVTYSCMINPHPLLTIETVCRNYPLYAPYFFFVFAPYVATV